LISYESIFLYYFIKSFIHFGVIVWSKTSLFLGTPSTESSKAQVKTMFAIVLCK